MIDTMISSSALILAIVLLRLILKDKISPNIRYGLWGLVVLRLVWPVFGTYIYVPLKGLADPLRSRFSVMNAADAVHRQVIAGTSLEYLTDNVATGHVYHFSDAGQTVTLAQRAAGIDWQLWIMVVWVLGSMLLGLWMFMVNSRFHKMLISRRKQFYGTMPVFVTERVYVVEGIQSPCYYGWGTDEGIYVPDSVVNDYQKLRHILAHEMSHVSNGDRYWGILRCGLLCLYWVNPLVWLAAVLSRQDCELACDEAAVKLLGERERFAYGRTLVGMIEARGKGKGIFSAATTMTAGPRIIRERIRILAAHQKTTRAMMAAVAGAVLLLGACTFTGSVETAGNGDVLSVAETVIHGNDTQPQVPQEEGETEAVPIGQGDMLALVGVGQWGDFYELTMERREAGSGRPLPVPRDYRENVKVTSYTDADGTILSGDGRPDRGYGYMQTDPEEFVISIWNAEHAGAFKISIAQDGRSVEYLFAADDREVLDAYTCHQVMEGPDQTRAALVSVEEYPNAFSMHFQGADEEEAAGFADNHRIGIQLEGYGDEGHLYEPVIQQRDGRDIYVLFCFDKDVFPDAGVRSVAVLEDGLQSGVYSALGVDMISSKVYDTALRFCQAYLSGDVKTAGECSVFSRKELENPVSMDDSEPPELRIRYQPDLKEVYAEAVYRFKEEGEDSYTYLNLELKYAYGEWKVTWKGFEK